MTAMEQIQTPTKLLADLDADEFAELYGCDRFTCTVLANRFRYIMDHASAKLLTGAFSPIIRDYYDFAACISGPPSLDYITPAVSPTLAVFHGALRDAVANTFDEFGVDELAPGDVIVSNDPFRIGTHVNDVCFIRPVFREGDLVAIFTIKAHMLDMGGIVPGGFSGMERNIYETGLVLPPTRLYQNDKPIKSTFNLILDNVRFGAMLLPDIQTIHKALLLGEELLLASLERYGLPALHGAMRYACDASAETMARAIERFPDGEFFGEDVLDCDGLADDQAYRVSARIKKVGHRLEIDFSGTSHQARTSINGAWPDSKTAVAIALKFMLDPRTPFNSGSLRHVDIVLPSGTLASAEPPDGPVFFYWEALQAVLYAVVRALRADMGEDAIATDARAAWIHSANGQFADGTPWVNIAQCGADNGGWGATSAGDADSGQLAWINNSYDSPIESIERDTPVVITRREYVADSCGAGTYRGGAGVVKDSYWLSDADHHCLVPHLRSVNGEGAAGGADGGVGAAWLWSPSEVDKIGPVFLPLSDDVYESSTTATGVVNPNTKVMDAEGEYVYWGRVPSWPTAPKAAWRYIGPGGGGWGDPFQRDPRLVLRDVRDGYVSIAGAAGDYGVVVVGDPENEPEQLQIDEAGTAQLRENDVRPQPLPTPEYESIAEPRSVTREHVDGQCPNCGRDDLAAYPVLAESGWCDVVKCQTCLHSVTRSKGRRLGALSLPGDALFG